LLFFRQGWGGWDFLKRIIIAVQHSSGLFSADGVRTCSALIKTEGLVTPLTAMIIIATLKKNHIYIFTSSLIIFFKQLNNKNNNIHIIIILYFL